MKISALVKPGSRKENVEKTGDGCFTVKVNAPAKDGKANRRAAQLLAEHLGIPKNSLILKRGVSSKQKIFEICE